jgi:TetR/AcrR family transcriptional regulator
MSVSIPPSSAVSIEPTHKRERRKEARPGELIEAALALFVDKGFAATRSEEVAARAGVSKGTLFLYFQTKEDLFREVIRTRLVDHLLAWDQEYDTLTGPTEDLLRYSVQTWWERIGSTPAGGLTKLILSESHNFPEIAAYYRDSVIRPGKELLRKILARGVERGEFRAIHIDHAVMSLVSAMVFVVTWKHSMESCTSRDEPFDPLIFLQAHLDLLLQGLRATPQACLGQPGL